MNDRFSGPEMFPDLEEAVMNTGSIEEIPRIEHDFLHFDSLDLLQTKKYFGYLQRRISDPTRFIDKGGAGSVFNINDTVCIKMMEDRYLLEELRAREEGRDPYLLNLGNRPVAEAHIQEHVTGLSVSNVRSPHILQYIPGRIWHGIVMERLNAVNVQHCLNGTVPFPGRFEHVSFLDSLGTYIEKLHSDKHVYHGDLEPRNVMINIDTGEPYVIDFGRSGWLRDGERSARSEDDWKKYDTLYAKIEAACT